MFNNSQTKQVQQLLQHNIHPYLQKIEARQIEILLKKYSDWDKKRNKIKQLQQRKEHTPETLAHFLCDYSKQQHQHILLLRQQYLDFNKRYQASISIADQHSIILDYAKLLGANWRQLMGDKRAFNRWFGIDAVIDRYQRRLSRTERHLCFCLQRLATVVVLAMDNKRKIHSTLKIWRQLEIEQYILPLLHHNGDARIRVAAFEVLSQAILSLPITLQENHVSPEALRFIYRATLDRKQDIKIQGKALSVLAKMTSYFKETPDLYQILSKRLKNYSLDDDLFVRRQAAQLLCQNIAVYPKAQALLPIVAKDPAAYVRQALVEQLALIPQILFFKWLNHYALLDDTAAVRASALLQILQQVQTEHVHPMLLSILIKSLQQEQTTFVLRTALKVAVDISHSLQQNSTPNSHAKVWQATLAKHIEHLHQTAKDIAVRRWAGQSAERVWCDMNADASHLRQQLQQWLATLAPEQQKRLPRPLSKNYDNATLARVLALFSQNDYGYNLCQHRWGKTVVKGQRFGFRLWRALFEFKHASPDKRQAHKHTVGRHFVGQLHIPSAIMSELAETKVPGEPLFMGSENGWRPYLPLVDELIDSLTRSHISIVTSEGYSHIYPPRSVFRRLTAYLHLTKNFNRYAHLRNWNEKGQSQANTYLTAVKQLGFDCHFSSHQRPLLSQSQPLSKDTTTTDMGCCDSAVQRFFPLLLPFYFPIHYGDLWPRLQEYFFSVYQNTVSQLTLFTAGIGALFIGNHVHQNHLLNQSRARLPLVLGGWGTRGKSGTERIKAAMLNGLGYSIFSKTTGCEAMFIYAPPFTPSKELFLFRPYDKATIWEQFNVLRLADKLGADVFLWECMGLTPAYVEVLQKRWTRDDISTITNTYPDHEDLQGPAGYDIPKVMTNFIPENAVLLTSEEQWLPVLRTAAEKFNTRIRPVTWLEAGLLTPDILARFPYEEHPYNIALVAALGEELGLDKTFALKAMADNVVADIGVLKTYPAAKILSRQLEFVMGMSANERFGAMGNWTRMGFDRHHLDVDPHIWLTTVINNRADRIPRSRVFASMLVEDVRADQHVLIGTNLTGMVGYIKEAWDSYAPSLTLWPTTKENEAEKTPEQVLLATAVHFRVPVTPEQLQKRLERMLGATDCCDESHKQSLLALWQEPEQLAEQLPKTLHPDIRQTMMDRMQRDIANFKTYQEFSQQLHQACDQTTRDNRFRALLWTWFEQKIFVVHSPYTTGNQIIKKIASLTPPGFYNRIMGMQNIKGTGLDFVYRFQAWENCHKALIQMQSNDSRVVEQGLMQLTSFKEHGYLTEEAVRETVAQLEQSPLGQREHIHAELTVLLSNLNQAMQEIQQQNQSDSGQQSNDGLLINVLHWLEEFLDAGDAVKRRKIADQIYKDMVGERISLQAAAQEIQKLNKRQKGGWLQQQVDTLKQKLKARKKPQQAQSASQHKI